MALDRDVRRLLRGLDEKLASRIDIEPTTLDEEDDRSYADYTRTIALIRNDERPAFFDYQDDLVARMSEILCNGGTTLLSLPTGAGKTRTAVGAFLEARRQLAGLRVCWVAPTYELLEQARSTAVQLWKQFGAAPDMRIAMVDAPVAEADLWLTTPQTVASRARRAKPLGEWQGVVFDEAHQMAAPTFHAAVDALRQNNARALVGLSATPGRSSEKETDLLIELFQGNLLTSSRLGLRPVEELQRRGVLSQLRFRPLSKREPSSLDEIERLRVIYRACRYLAHRARRVLVFTSSVAAAQALSLALTQKEVAANWVSGSMSLNERQSRIQSFATGMTQVLANQRLLATGYDCPAVTDVIIQTKISSTILFEQIVGRVARGPLTGGARTGTVWQFEDHLLLHGLPQSYYRYRDYDWT